MIAFFTIVSPPTPNDCLLRLYKSYHKTYEQFYRNLFFVCVSGKDLLAMSTPCEFCCSV